MSYSAICDDKRNLFFFIDIPDRFRVESLILILGKLFSFYFDLLTCRLILLYHYDELVLWPQVLLVPLPLPLLWPRRLVVLHGRAQLLLVAPRLAVLRRKAKRLLVIDIFWVDHSEFDQKMFQTYIKGSELTEIRVISARGMPEVFPLGEVWNKDDQGLRYLVPEFSVAIYLSTNISKCRDSSFMALDEIIHISVKSDLWNSDLRSQINCLIFREMFIHHMTTIGLMVCSWTVNLWRVGTLVLLIHDCADIFLEVSELRQHAETKTTTPSGCLAWYFEADNKSFHFFVALETRYKA